MTAGEVVDRSVSGAVDPAERPQLGPWLTPEGLDRWDVMAVVSQDRLGRDDLHFFAFVHLLLTNEKSLVVLDDPGFDLTNPTGRLIAYVKAAQAAEELRKIRQRCSDARKWLRDNGHYGGGQTPCGYLPERPYEGAHSVLVPDPRYRDLLRDLAARVRRGDSTNLLALELNTRGVLTWRDHVRQLKRDAQAAAGVPLTAPVLRGTTWKASILAQILRSPAMAGYLVRGGEIHYLDSGEPAMLTEYPILTHDEWRDTVRALDARSRPRRIVHTGTAEELSGIGACRSCGNPLFHQNNRRHLVGGRVVVYRYYRCTARGNGIPCPGPAAIHAAELEDFYGAVLLEQVGGLSEVVRRHEAGSDHTSEIDELQSRLARLEADYEKGRYDDDLLRESYFRSLRRISAQRDGLRAAPVRPARTWFQATGRTIGQAWDAMDTPNRREYLDGAGVRIILWRTGHKPGAPGIAVRLGDIRSMAEALHGLPPVESPPPPIMLRNLSRPMYFAAVKAGCFSAPRTRLRL